MSNLKDRSIGGRHMDIHRGHTTQGERNKDKALQVYYRLSSRKIEQQKTDS